MSTQRPTEKGISTNVRLNKGHLEQGGIEREKVVGSAGGRIADIDEMDVVELVELFQTRSGVRKYLLYEFAQVAIAVRSGGQAELRRAAGLERLATSFKLIAGLEEETAVDKMLELERRIQALDNQLSEVMRERDDLQVRVSMMEPQKMSVGG